MIEWGSYLDKSMPSEQREEIRQRLDVEPQLRKELEGYQQFVDILQSIGSEERVPIASLEAMLSSIVQKKKRWWQAPVFQYGVPVAATCLALSYIVISSIPPYVAPSFETSTFDNKRVLSSKDASDWIRLQTGWGDLPKFSLTSFNPEFSLAEVAKDWACCDFKINRSFYCLRMSPTIKMPDETLHVGKGGLKMVLRNGVYWREGKYTMYLLGGSSKDERIAIAEAIHEESTAANVAQFSVKDMIAGNASGFVTGRRIVSKL